MSTRTLAERTVSAGQWRMAAWGIQAVLQLAVGVLLARLLPPAEFGLAGLAMVVITFATLVSEMGLGIAVVQRRPLTDRHLRTAFTASLSIGIAAAAAIYLLAPLAAPLLRSPQLPPLLRAMTLVFVFGAAGATARATLQRAMDFRRLFATDVASYALNERAVEHARRLIDAHQYVLQSEWGDVQPTAKDENAFLESHHINNKTDCQSCWARPICAGGCYHEAHTRYGSTEAANLHYCEWIRAWTHTCLEVYGSLAERRPEFLRKLVA